MRAIHRSTLCLSFGALALQSCARSDPDAETSAQDTQTAAPQAMSAAPDSVMPQDIADVTWQWVSFTTPVEQITVDGPDRYTIQFGRDGRLTMRADCNRGMGSYSVTADRRITMGPIALTRAMCPEGSLSDRFAREVGRASIYFMRDGDLYLDLPMDSGTLRFRRSP